MHYYDECKVLGEFGAKHVKANPTKYHGNHNSPKNKSNSQQENNSIINNVVYEILLNETQKVSASR